MKKLVLALLASSVFASPAGATAAYDPLIEGAKLCTRQLPRYEREYGIPTHLLSAIATTESGRYHDGLKIRIPWPWTINAEGKGYYFNSKGEAMEAVHKLQHRGVQSIDVGCMQVNLFHHGHAFSSLDEAFEPQTNVAYAANFLRGLYQEEGSWKKAAADYHSKVPQRGSEYAGQVYNSWYQIVDKLRAARLQVPDAANQQAMLSSPAVPDAYVRHITQDEQPAAPVVPQRLAEQVGRKLPQHQAPHMNSIQVTSQRDDGLIVVKPTIKVVDETSAQSVHVTRSRAGEPVADAMVIPVSDHSGDATGVKPGPHFIFND